MRPAMYSTYKRSRWCRVSFSCCGHRSCFLFFGLGLVQQCHRWILSVELVIVFNSFRCERLAFTQVDDMYVFTVADSSRVDSFEIVVEEVGHNALEDLDGPMKVIPQTSRHVPSLEFCT